MGRSAPYLVPKTKVKTGAIQCDSVLLSAIDSDKLLKAPMEGVDCELGNIKELIAKEKKLVSHIRGSG
jgi:hypothetical protein